MLYYIISSTTVFFRLSSYFTQYKLSQLQIWFLGLSAHLTNSYVNKVTMATSVWQIHSYKCLPLWSARWGRRNSWLSSVLYNTTYPEGSTPINKVNAWSTLRTKKSPMTEVVEWRVNITEPRHMTGTWQNRPSKFNGKQLNFYALRISVPLFKCIALRYPLDSPEVTTRTSAKIRGCYSVSLKRWVHPFILWTNFYVTDFLPA